MLRLNFDWPDERPINEEIFLILEELDIESMYEVSNYLNSNGLSKLTICPKCHIDDFTHVKGCELDRFNPEDE